jgi:hypothetical protein
MNQLDSLRSEMELRMLVDLRKDAVQNIRNDARFDSISEDLRDIADTILCGHGQIFSRLTALTQTFQRKQLETNMLIKQSGDKIADAIAALAISTSPGNA